MVGCLIMKYPFPEQAYRSGSGKGCFIDLVYALKLPQHYAFIRLFTI